MLNISIIILALIGLSICIFINLEKKKDKPMVCPIGADCDAVVRSKYSQIGRISLEIFGGLYYVAIAVTTMALSLYPTLNTDILLSAIFLASALGFVAAIILLSLQAFVLKTWCTWCLGSATISIAIFILEFWMGSSIAKTLLSMFS